MAAAGVEEGFLPVVAPASAAFNGVNDYYKTDEEYVYALSEALRTEYLAIYEAGLVLQVDDAVLANAYDDLMARSPETYRKWAEVRIEALNHALRGIPADRVRYHLCYGSWHAPHVSDGRWRRSSTSSCASTPARILSRPPTCATRMSGASGKRTSCRRASR